MYEVALKMLIGDKAKFYGLIFGVTIATFLMSQQLSIFVGILSRTASQIIDVQEANVWVMQPDVKYVDEIKGVRDMDLYRVRGVTGVKWAVPFFKGAGIIQAPGNVFKQVILLGVDDATLIGKPPLMLKGNWDDIKQPNSIIIDRAGWNLLWPGEPFKIGRVVEMSDQRLVIVGECDTSAPFLTLPIVYTRYTEAIRLAAHERNMMSFVLVKTQDGYDPKQVAKLINQQTGLQGLTKNSFIQKTINFYLLYTGIPINFGITIALGFLIGTAIAGQTFYLFIIENLKQFAALKAMGVTNKQLLGMVLVQASLIAYLGFGIGIGLAALFFESTTNVDTLRGVFLTWPIVIGTAFSITFIMIISSIIGIKKVFVVAPAEVFKG